MLLSPQQGQIYQNHAYNEVRYVSPAPMMAPPPPPVQHYQYVPPSKNIIVTGGGIQQMEQ